MFNTRDLHDSNIFYENKTKVVPIRRVLLYKEKIQY